jgi:hypothetical protein
MKRASLKVYMLAVIGALLLSVTAADAQDWRRGRDSRRDYNKADVERIIKSVEERSDVFRKNVDRQLDHSRLNGSRTEDRINEEVKQFERALDRLRDEFNRRDSWEQTRSNVERVLRESDEIDQLMRRSRMGGGVDQQWSVLRSELNTLARAYDLKRL